MSNSINYYELPSIRCKNCNKPIAHIFSDFKKLIQLGHEITEVFKILKVDRFCCRKEFYVQKIPLSRCIEEKVKDLTIIKSNIILNENYNKEEITTGLNIVGIPISIKTSNIVKKLNDVIFVNYVSESIYLAQ